MVEAIETLFVPVCVYNNGDGADAEALKRFDEPAWNNPVVRFLDASGRDLIPREERVWDTAGLARRVNQALAAALRPPPVWLERTELEARRAHLPRAVLAMHCFWEGQEKLGGLAGVADARPAFLDGREVVELRYDPVRLSLEDLLRAAERAGLADTAWLPGEEEFARARALLGERAARLAQEPQPAPDSDDLRALKRTPIPALGPSRAQAVRLNADVAARGAPDAGTLSPRQVDELRRRAQDAQPR